MKPILTFIFIILLATGLVFLLDGWNEEAYQHSIAVAEEAQAFDEQLAQIAEENDYQPYHEFIYSDDGTVSIDLSTHQNKE